MHYSHVSACPCLTRLRLSSDDLQYCYNNIWLILFLTNDILEFLDLYCKFQCLQVPSKQTLVMENI